MKAKMQHFFSLTDKGIDNVFKAATFSFLKFLSYMFPPMLVFFFLQDVMDKQVKPLTIYMGILAVTVVVLYLIFAREYTLTYDATYEESVDLRIRLANKIKELPLSYFSTHNVSDLSQTVMMDVNNIEMTMSHALPQGIGFLAFFVLMTLLLAFQQPLLSLTVTGPIWLTIALMLFSRNIQTQFISKYYQKLLDNAASFQEAFEMQQEIKSYSMQDLVEADVLAKLEDTEKWHLKSEFTMALTSSAIGLLPFLSPVFTAVAGAILLNNGQISILYYVGYLMAATTLSAKYGGLNEYLLMVLYFRDSFSRIREINEETVQEGQDIAITNFDIVCDQVSFGYGDNAVIQEVSFTAKQGQVTALVGPSGCGKTTMLRLLSRLYDYQSGHIYLGGQDIQTLSTRTLFENISVVFQQIDLFDTTIMENIRMGRKTATDEEVLAAARLANVDKMIEKLPDGYQTVIGENGSKLSGGERQRISIARAFLKDAPIILLDEMSASIDVENEMEIQQSINQLIQDKTVMIISHRLKSVEKVDQIIVMEDGRVADQGTHDSLLATSPLYRSMVEKSHLTENYMY